MIGRKRGLRWEAPLAMPASSWWVVKPRAAPSPTPWRALSGNRELFGELDHPESPVVSLKNASHIVKELYWKGNDLMGKVELLNTPAGNIVKEIIKAGHTIGISSRGTGSVQQTNEGTLEVQPDFELVCWDFVSNPSTHGAFMNPISLNEGKVKVSKYANLDNIINDILRS